ncbi:retrovirus-related pol polyprotein from transposon TNT 1-94, partial [Tanacetum coccineum]
MLTRSMVAKLTAASANECLFADFLSEIEPKKVWTLVALLGGKIAIGSKWVFRNKNDELGTVIRNKVRLGAQGYSQEEGINYDKTFAPLKEEVYVKQPIGFESSEFPNYVCKLDKALYGLNQASRAWYETLSTFLIQNKFVRGRIDNTLFIYKTKGVVMLVQVYVDDIIFGSTNYKLYDKGIFICQEKYTRDLLKKYEISDISSVKTPMVPLNNLGSDHYGMPTNEILYRGMIETMMYLTASWPDIQFSTCLCVRYQDNPKESHLIAVKRISKYLKGTPNLGLWYPKCSGFDLKGLAIPLVTLLSNSELKHSPHTFETHTSSCNPPHRNMLANWNTTINLSPCTRRLGTPTFETRLINDSFFSSKLLAILGNHAAKKTTSKFNDYQRLIAQRMADMLFRLERNDIRDA